MEQGQEPLLQVAPQGVLLSTLALIALLLCIPPMVWHSRNKNFPTACLIAWYIISNFYNFVNPLIWPTDDVNSWWMGYGYCDIQTKLQTGSGVGISGPLVCIFRSLARVLDSNRTSLTPSKAEKRFNLAFDVFFCIIFPVLIMLLHYVVQERRYYIYSIVGCMPAFHNSWPSFVLSLIWPAVVLIIAVFYCSK